MTAMNGNKHTYMAMHTLLARLPVQLQKSHGQGRLRKSAHPGFMMLGRSINWSR